MAVVDDVIKSIMDTIFTIDPSLSAKKKEVADIVRGMINGQLADPTIILDNNVVGVNKNIKLTDLCDYIDKETPVVSGNATFYVQPVALRSPTSGMLRSLKKGRKATKKKMFSYPPTSDEYQMLDLDQQNQKVIMNADYGGSGTKTAAFYTKYNPPATTHMARSIITTMAAFFEGFVGDNQKFYSLSEFFDWAHAVRSKTEPIDSWIVIPNKDELKQRIRSHFIEQKYEEQRYVSAYIDNLNDREVAYMYYTNNLNMFIGMHKQVWSLLQSILETLPKMEVGEKEVPAKYAGQFDSVSAYNKFMSKEMFLDPYNPPECIKSTLEEFIDLTAKYIYTPYLTPDSIVKLNNHKRNTVLLVDTDSNIINSDLFVSYVTKDLFAGMTFGRKPMYNDMILANVLAATLSKSVASMLDHYGRAHNMDEEARAELAMKNEFMFRRLFLMEVKKRYSASIVLREGNIIYPFKPEIKGMDFIKAGISTEVEENFKRLLCDRILFSDKLQLHELMADVKNFEREIYETTRNGDSKFLKQAQYKPLNSYATKVNEDGNIVSTGWSQPVFRGSYIWNELYPENQIKILDQVKIVKLLVVKASDLDRIKTDFPDIYNKLMDIIFINGSPELKRAGLKTICIPTNIKIPEWMIPLINYDVIISDIISSFRSVLDALHLQEFTFKTSAGKASTTSCLISL